MAAVTFPERWGYVKICPAALRSWRDESGVQRVVINDMDVTGRYAEILPEVDAAGVMTVWLKSL